MVLVANIRVGLMLLLASVVAMALLLTLSKETSTSVAQRFASIASAVSSPDQSVQDRATSGRSPVTSGTTIR